MAVHIIASDCIIDQPLSSQENTLLPQRTFDEDSGRAYRGFLFAMLFNVFLSVSGVALWLLLRK
jgi:hypothetical protein